ncbi:alpha/beta hydrolase family protein [Dysgonomonas macrotermitis]|uniref:Acetyl xylan esterase (AXE1) n=1 Tax=Dysgonomonas macrotermitis TaxID=1346286 RepID=A0A1M4VZL8_9BACT|nr:acetylxylan esterase [Dysgonomonas macrotermitis]SHE74162.1 Acetyl xylan esterase (AXE1) [Dysgonomonas macrotermitis]
MKRIFLTILGIFLLSGGFAQDRQTADSAFVRPLLDVLMDIEKQFDITIKYDKKMIDGKMLKYADWRIKPWSAEESLNAVLAPFDYKFVMDNGKYKIKEFEYARSNEAEGKKFLDYLETLYSDKAGWEKRKAELKSCLPKALHLSPLPAKPDSKVILTSKRKYDGYTVENFAIETLPGIYVTGSVYKPEKIKDKCPVMLNPNGHFGNGRYREDQQKRCAMQARMGIISASWDIFAWGESLLQFDGTLHRLSAANTIQTLNTLRVLDYLLSLKEADHTRVGITGGSGGGSMTMMIAAIDDRITLSIPVVMLSSYFVGGCPCESGMPAHLCGNRTNNAEIAAMFAPKPQLVLSDGKDWTNVVPELEYPFLKRTYAFYNAENNIENEHFPTEGHDYGLSKRKAMYRFVAKHFNLDLNKILDKYGEFDESKVTVEKESQMYVFGDKGEKLPVNAIKGKDALLKVLRDVGILDK